MALLHKCDRCGSLSDEGVRAQNKYADWLIVRISAAPVPYRDDFSAEPSEKEWCVTCKREFNWWQENVIRDECANGE